MIRFIVLLASAFVMFGCASGNKDANYASTNVPELQPTSGFRNPTADTDTDVVTEQRTVRVEKCGGNDGVARLYRRNGDLRLRVENIECGSYRTDIGGRRSEVFPMSGDGQRRFLDIDVDENIAGWHTVTVGSRAYFNNPQAGSKADIIQFYVPARNIQIDLVWDRDGKSEQKSIPNCGGTVQAQINRDRSLSIVYRDVQQCRQLQIRIGDFNRNYELQEQSNGFGGSFNIPPSAIVIGQNEASLYLSANRGRESRLNLRFLGARQ